MFEENGQAASGDSKEGADAMDVEMSLPEPSLLGSLQKNTLQHEAKHQICRTNGNISGHVQKKTGAPINMLCTKLVIQSQSLNKKNVMAPYFNCIACDKGRTSNKHSRAFSHVDECNVCAPV